MDSDSTLIPRIRLATLLLAGTLTVMAGATIAPSLPAIQLQFGTEPSTVILVSLVLTLPALFIAIGAPLTGWVVDIVGRRPILLSSLVLYAFAGTTGFYLDSLSGILVGRALLGIAVAGVMTSATTLVADYYVGEQRDGVIGMQAAAMSFGGVIFLPVGGALADIGWRFPFLIYTASLLLLPTAYVSLPEPRDGCDPRVQYDPQLCDPVTGLPISDGEMSESESTGVPPISRLSLAAVYLTGVISMVAFYTIPVQLPFYLQQLVGANGIVTGLSIAVAPLAGGLVSTQFRHIRRRLDAVHVIALLFGLLAIGFVLLGTATTLFPILAGLAVAGVGLGLLLPNLNGWLADNAPVEQRGRLLGGLTSVIFLGQFLSPLVTQPLLATVGYGRMYLVIGVIVFGLAIVATIITVVPLHSRLSGHERQP
jgi:MFS family permease